MHRVLLHYDKRLIREAVFGFWRRVVGFRFLAALVVTAAALVVLVSRGDRSWVVGVLASALALGVAFVAAVYAIHYRNAIDKLAAMGDPQASLIADDDAISFSSGAGSVTLPWSAIAEIWRFETYWLLLFSKAQFVTLPLANTKPETRDFILDKVRAAGGRID